MGVWLSWLSSRTIRYSSGASCSVTGLDRVGAIAILSPNQYNGKLNTSPMPSARIAPCWPPIAPPINTNRPPRAAIRIQVLTRLRTINGNLPVRDSTSPRVGFGVVLPVGDLLPYQSRQRREMCQELRPDADGHDRHRRAGGDRRDHGRSHQGAFRSEGRRV